MAEVRDMRGGGWARVDNEIIDDYGIELGAYGIAVYVVLAKVAGSKSIGKISIPKIAAKIGAGVTVVTNAIKTLEELGLIEVERTVIKTKAGKTRNLTNAYTLLKVKKKPPGDNPTPSDNVPLPRLTGEPTPPGNVLVVKEPIVKDSIVKDSIGGADDEPGEDSLPTEEEIAKAMYIHPAVELWTLYKESAKWKNHMPYVARPKVVDAVGIEDRDLCAWDELLEIWVGNTWKFGACYKQVEAFEKWKATGFNPANKPGSYQGGKPQQSKNGRAGNYPAQEEANIDAIKELLAKGK